MPRSIVPIILPGGSGTQLWPLSRGDCPTQLIAVSGEQSLLQETALRVADASRFQAPVVIARASHADAVEAQLDAIDRNPAQLIVEPEARGSAAAVALAALTLRPGDLMLVLPGDHLVQQPEALRVAIEAALPLARDGMLVAFGAQPDRPEPGYSYVARGEAISPGLFRAERFVERPDLATAKRFLTKGDHLWNTGIFLIGADAYLDALEVHAPAILSAARSAVVAQRAEGARIWPDARGYARSPTLSLDEAVLDKSDRVAVVPVAMGWSEIGSWEALHAIGDKDASGNLLTGNVVAIDSRDCLIRSDGPVVVTIGAESMLVVAIEGAVLIAPRGESHRIKDAVAALQKRGT